jgi:ribosomal protein L35
VGHGQFLRKQAGTNHYNRKMSASKRYKKKMKVLANVQQRNLLRQLVPYWKKKYMKRIAPNVNPDYIDLK